MKRVKLNRRPRIGFDVDGVLTNLLDLILPLLNERYGANLTPDLVLEWDIVAAIVPPQDLAAFWNEIGAPGYVHSRLQPYPGAVDGYHRIAMLADPYIVTSHPHSATTWVYERQGWLYEQFGVPFNKINNTHAKYTFFGDVFVDDKTENVVRWQQEHPNGIGVLWSHPYNEGADVKVRTNSWDDLEQLVAAL